MQNLSSRKVGPVEGGLLMAAAHLAQRHRSSRIELLHVLLAMCSKGPGSVASLSSDVAALGVPCEQVKAQVERLLESVPTRRVSWGLRSGTVAVASEVDEVLDAARDCDQSDIDLGRLLHGILQRTGDNASKALTNAGFCQADLAPPD